ncbi:MAG TPA: dihydrodipicolinate synthase family protein [Anaerolineales bacterium]|nr:dihydrodipicolinate synthase family protein [Anaerolineales bacterium]
MMDLHPLAGVYAAAVTPLNPDSSLDLESVPLLIRFLASRGCHGALFFGTTGEGPSFSPTERETLMREAIHDQKQYPNFRFLAGTGTPSLSETIQLTKLAFDLGYDGVVVLPPYYFRTSTDDGLFNWYSELIKKTVPSDGFLLGYHIPGTAGIGLSFELLVRLKDAFPSQFAGIKDSSGNGNLVQALGRRFGSDLLVLTGTDSDLQFSMQNHAQGCITAAANLISPILREAWNLMQAGKDITELQARITRQRKVLESYPPFSSAMKALLYRIYDFPRWLVRPPLMSLSAKDEEKLLAEFQSVK